MWTSTKQEGKSPRPPCLGRMPNKTFEGLGVSTLFHNLITNLTKGTSPEGIYRNCLQRKTEIKWNASAFECTVRSTIQACRSPVPILSRFFCLHLEAPSARQSKDWRKGSPSQIKTLMWIGVTSLRQNAEWESKTEIEDLECKSPAWDEPSCGNPGFMLSFGWNHEIIETANCTVAICTKKVFVSPSAI